MVVRLHFCTRSCSCNLRAWVYLIAGLRSSKLGRLYDYLADIHESQCITSGELSSTRFANLFVMPCSSFFGSTLYRVDPPRPTRQERSC